MVILKTPVNNGDVIEIAIDDILNNGEGMGTIEGYKIFVPKSLPGDVVKVKIISRKISYARGNIVELVRPSSYRIESPCSIFNKCGGCQLLSLPYDKQLEIKSKFVLEALTRVGGIKDIKMLPIQGMDNPFEYRNKAQVPLGFKNKVIAGYYIKGTNEIVDCPNCFLLSKEANTLLSKIKGIFDNNKVSIYTKKNPKGMLRHVIIRQAFNTKEIMIILVSSKVLFTHKNDIIKEIADLSKNIKSIYININNTSGNKILGEFNALQYGKEKIADELLGLTFKLSPTAFYQVNIEQAEKVYKAVFNFAKLTGKEKVLDLYCGIGTISLILSKRSLHVTGIEVNPDAIRDAKENAITNNINNVSFFAMAAENIFDNLFKSKEKYNVIIINPPRKGCSKDVLENITKLNPEKIIYVSCNPATLARDIKDLMEKGYNPQYFQPVDMFPHTVHVECVVLIERK